MGTTVSTVLRVRNLTNSDIISILAFDIDNFDFGSQLRPDKIFNGSPLKIPSKGCIEKTIELNTIASNCPFALKLNFQNGLEDIIKINFKHVYDNTDPNFRHLKKSHTIVFHKPCSRLLEIVVKNTVQQIENEEAERLNKEGSELLSARQYDDASVKFWEASQIVNQLETKLSISKNQRKIESIQDEDVDNKAKSVNAEGFELLQGNKFHQALEKFEEGLKLAVSPSTIDLLMNNLDIARQAKIHQDMKKLNQEGLLLRKNNQNEEAIRKFNEALALSIPEGDPELLNSIERNKTDTLLKQAKIVLEDADLTELSTKTTEAIDKYSKAKFLLTEANSIQPNAEYENIIQLVDSKIQGNIYIVLAQQFEKDGSELLNKILHLEGTDNSTEMTGMAKRNYENAKSQYEEAKKKFEEGMDKVDKSINCEQSLEIVKEAIGAIDKILNELEKTELEIVLQKIGSCN